jgi:transposase
MDIQVAAKSSRYYTDPERHQIIHEYLSTRITKQQIWYKYTGELTERGRLLRWMRNLGYVGNIKQRVNIVENSEGMAKKKTPEKPSIDQDESFEMLQLKKRISDLERQLKDAELKAIAFSTMVDIAEQEFKIPIRKKFNTKP